MKVSNNIHNIPCLEDVEFIQEWTEQEKIPVKASPVTVPPPKKEEEKKEGEQPAAEGEQKPAEEPKPEVTQPEQQYEIKERKKKTFKKIKFATSNFALAPKQRIAFTDLETQLNNEDTLILETKQAKNNLEAYSYEMRNNLESYGSFEKYLEDSLRSQFLADISVVVDWIYGEGENSTKEEYLTRLKKFREIGEPVKARHFYYTELDVYFGQFEDLRKKITERADVIEHITPEQVEQIKGKIATAQALFDGVKADRAAKQLFQDPKYTLDQIIDTLTLLKAESESIFAAVKPPKKEEAPKEDVKMDESKPADDQKPADAEMNNEEAQPEESKQ